jgi:hypothetical protein
VEVPLHRSLRRHCGRGRRAPGGPALGLTVAAAARLVPGFGVTERGQGTG